MNNADVREIIRIELRKLALDLYERYRLMDQTAPPDSILLAVANAVSKAGEER